MYSSVGRSVLVFQAHNNICDSNCTALAHGIGDRKVRVAPSAGQTRLLQASSLRSCICSTIPKSDPELMPTPELQGA
jgi:hypothetical protein